MILSSISNVIGGSECGDISGRLTSQPVKCVSFRIADTLETNTGTGIPPYGRQSVGIARNEKN